MKKWKLDALRTARRGVEALEQLVEQLDRFNTILEQETMSDDGDTTGDDDE